MATARASMLKISIDVDTLDVDDSNGEQSSLLRQDLPRSDDHGKNDKAAAGVKKRAYLSICMIIILIQIGQCLQKAPLIQLYESIICHNLGGESHAETPRNDTDGFCKSEPVQSELASIRALQMFFEQLPGLYFTFVHPLCESP
jgi:hypothetical protein